MKKRNFLLFLILLILSFTSLNKVYAAPVIKINDKNIHLLKNEDSAIDNSKESEIYDDVKNRLENQVQNTIDKAIDSVKSKTPDNPGDSFWNGYMIIYNMYKWLAPIVICVVISFGGMIALFARRNKGLRRWAISTFCVGVPLLILILVFGPSYIIFTLTLSLVIPLLILLNSMDS